VGATPDWQVKECRNNLPQLLTGGSFGRLERAAKCHPIFQFKEANSWTTLPDMNTPILTVGMKITHPHHGEGIVEKVSGGSADIRFGNSLRTIDPRLAEISVPEPTVKIGEVEVPLKQFVESIIASTVDHLGIEQPDVNVEELGLRWHKGKVVLHPADPTLQTKEVPLEVFFHKIVGVRNQLRVLEQKINAHANLNDGEKVEMQQYISRCYGSLTTFNILFKNKEDQFSSGL
jgi:hypothetical protein